MDPKPPSTPCHLLLRRIGCRWITPLALCAFVSCENETALPAETASSQDGQAERALQEGVEGRLAEHLGFARHVPADADVFFGGYHGDQAIRGILDPLMSLFIEKSEIVVEGMEADGEGDEAEDGAPEPQAPRSMESMPDELAAYFGKEATLFVGGGAGRQLEVLARTHRRVSAGVTGSFVGMMLDWLNEGEQRTGIEENQMEFFNEVVGDLIDAVETDSRLQLPSVVVSWSPDPSKKEELLEMMTELLSDLVDSNPSMVPVTFDHHGAVMSGYQVNGQEVFGELLAEAKQSAAQLDPGDEWSRMISSDRLDRLLEALESFEFTVAAGSLDGYLMVYLGNGVEGFRLAEGPDDSLAATAACGWTNQYSDDETIGFCYLSEAMVRAGLPWIDRSPYWQAVADALREPIGDQRLFAHILEEMSRVEGRIAERDASAWSGILIRDRGWRLETRGGWIDPSLDYEAPLQMTGAASVAEPVFRAHWVQNRERNDLVWERNELLAILMEALVAEFEDDAQVDQLMIPEDSPQKLVEGIRHLNRVYRDGFRNGIGDEVALVADLHGMTPPIPGIPAEIVDGLELPRFVLARPVTDRGKVSQAGREFTQAWKDGISATNQTFDLPLPLLTPQSVESNELMTWYFPLPVTGGDFIPGISVNDRVWIVGTSRSMADGFSKSLTTASAGGETGMILEVDFGAVWDWFGDSYALTKEQAAGLGAVAPDSLKDLASDDNQALVLSGITRLRSYRYHHRLQSGVPRTSRHLVIAPKP